MLTTLVLLFAQTVTPGDPPVALAPVDPLSGRADHGEVAINDDGDFLVVWHCEVDPINGPDELRIEAQYGAFDPVAQEWVLSTPFVLAEPQIANQRCHKPDVEALGNGDFAVVWARMVIPGDDQLEAAIVRDASPSVPMPVIEQAAPGIGFLIDDGLRGEPLGIMPEIASSPLMAPGEFAVTYIQVTDLIQSPPTIEMEIRWASVTEVAGQWVGNPQTLVSGIPIEGPLAERNSSLGLPDVLFVEDAQIALAWEQCEMITATDYRSSIELRLLDFSPGALPTIAQTHSFRSGVGPEVRLMRRPRLAHSPFDPRAAVTISYHYGRFREVGGNLETFPSVACWEVDFDNGWVRALPMPRDPVDERISPTPVATLGMRGVFYSWRQYNGPDRFLARSIWDVTDFSSSPGELIRSVPGFRNAVKMRESLIDDDVFVLVSQFLDVSAGDVPRIQVEARLGDF